MLLSPIGFFCEVAFEVVAVACRAFEAVAALREAVVLVVLVGGGSLLALALAVDGFHGLGALAVAVVLVVELGQGLALAVLVADLADVFSAALNGAAGDVDFIAGYLRRESVNRLPQGHGHNNYIPI